MNTIKVSYCRMLSAGIASAVGIISTTQFVCKAEGPIPRGNAQWGVNRRVTSDPGFIEVKGTFTMEFGLPKNAAGNVTSVSNSQNSSPSFYLGGSGTGTSGDVEVDAGLQWYFESVNGVPPGWAAFISVNKQQVNPKVYSTDIQDYAPWRGHGKTFDLDYKVTTDGHVQLDVSGLGTFYWNQAASPSSPPPNVWPNPSSIWPNVGIEVMDPNHLDENRVKRVIAMTRTTGYSDGLDGSWLKCIFRQGKLFSSANRLQEKDWTWLYENMSPDHTLGPTGYDTDGGGYSAIDALRNGRKTSKSRYRVDFPALDGHPTSTELIPTGRNAGSEKETEGTQSRYVAETVRINLRTYQSLLGNRVKVGP